MADDRDARTPPADVRLLVPALLAWAAVALALGRGPWIPLGLGVLLGVGALVVASWRRVGGPAETGAGPTGPRGQWSARPADPPARSRSEARRAVLTLGLLLAAALLLRVAAAERGAEAGPVGELAQERAAVVLEGRVGGEPRPLRRVEPGPARVAVVVQVTRVDARGLTTPVDTPVLVLGGPEWADVGWRDVVEMRGRLEVARRGEEVRAVLRPFGGPTVRRGPGAVVAASDVVREAMRAVTTPLPDDARGLVPAMIIGDRRAVPEDLAEAMRATGMTHLTAVSGTNCSLVVAGALWVCGWVGIPRRGRPLVGLCVLAGFVVLARPDPSVLRAAVMGAVGLVGVARSRRTLGLPALAGALLVLLAVDPWLARSFGFALSVLATTGLLVLAGPWSEALHTGLRLPRPVAVGLAIPLAAQVMCAPVVVLLQEEISVVGILTNALAGPLVAPVTLLGAAVALLAPFWPTGAGAVAWVAAVPALGIARLARAGESAPLRAVPWPGGAAGAVTLAVLLLVVVLTAGPLWRRVRGRVRRRPGVALLAALVVGALLVPVLVVRSRTGFPGPSPAVVMCDVGQGDALVLASGERRAVVLDVGPDPERLDRCLDSLGVEVVDAVVLTHFDADHVGGLAGLERGRSVGDVVVSAASMQDIRPGVERWWRAHGRPVHEVVRGDTLRWGDVSAVVRGPRSAHSGASSANDGSLVLDVVVDGPEVGDAVRGLFLADAGEEAGSAVRSDLRSSSEPPLPTGEGTDGSGRSDVRADMPFDLVKVAHHGSSDHDAPLLALVAAPVALVSVGADNTYGHPAPSLLAHVRAAGSVVYRTDRDGAVAVRKEDGRLLVVREHRRDGPAPAEQDGGGEGTARGATGEGPGLVGASGAAPGWARETERRPRRGRRSRGR